MNEIYDILKKFNQSGGTTLTNQNKQAIKRLYKEELNGTLNIFCSSCMTSGMKKLYKHLEKKGVYNTAPEPTPEPTPTPQPSLQDMNMNELRELANVLGVKNARSRKQMIYNIENMVC